MINEQCPTCAAKPAVLSAPCEICGAVEIIKGQEWPEYFRCQTCRDYKPKHAIEPNTFKSESPTDHGAWLERGSRLTGAPKTERSVEIGGIPNALRQTFNLDGYHAE